MAPCLPFLYSSDIYWVKHLKCPRSSAQKSKTPLGVNVQVHFWMGESWTSALPCFFSPAYKIQKCHPRRHSTLLLSKQMLYNSFPGLFIYIPFFPSHFQRWKKECGMDTQIIHSTHWNVHLLIYPMKCWETQYRDRQWPASMTTELPPTSSAAVRPGSQAPCLQQLVQNSQDLVSASFPHFCYFQLITKQKKNTQICLPN